MEPENRKPIWIDDVKMIEWNDGKYYPVLGFLNNYNSHLIQRNKEGDQINTAWVKTRFGDQVIIIDRKVPGRTIEGQKKRKIDKNYPENWKQHLLWNEEAAGFGSSPQWPFSFNIALYTDDYFRRVQDAAWDPKYSINWRNAAKRMIRQVSKRRRELQKQKMLEEAAQVKFFYTFPP